MNTSTVIHREPDHHRQQLRLLQAEYYEAIRLNKEFGEVKKIYEALKKATESVQSTTQKNHYEDNP
jgi:hypothetical protein